MSGSSDVWVARCSDCDWKKECYDMGTGVSPEESAKKAKAGHLNSSDCETVVVGRKPLTDLLVDEEEVEDR